MCNYHISFATRDFEKYLKFLIPLKNATDCLHLSCQEKKKIMDYFSRKLI